MSSTGSIWTAEYPPANQIICDFFFFYTIFVIFKESYSLTFFICSQKKVVVYDLDIYSALITGVLPVYAQTVDHGWPCQRPKAHPDFYKGLCKTAIEKLHRVNVFGRQKKKVKLFQTAIAALHAQRASNIPPVSSGISSKDVRPLTLLLGGGGKLQWTCSAGPFIYGSSTCCPETVALPELDRRIQMSCCCSQWPFIQLCPSVNINSEIVLHNEKADLPFKWNEMSKYRGFMSVPLLASVWITVFVFQLLFSFSFSNLGSFYIQHMSECYQMSLKCLHAHHHLIFFSTSLSVLMIKLTLKCT